MVYYLGELRRDYMAKQSSKKAESKQKTVISETSQYHFHWLIVGLIVFFTSILILFNGGVVGSLFANLLRLLIGETYTLWAFSAVLVSIYLIVKGTFPAIRWYQYVGVSCILIALTTLLHTNAFSQELPQNIFSITYQLFKNDLATQQMRSNIGGGMLGALCYATFGYFFGRWGTYLFCIILFIIGLCLIENFSIGLVQEAILALFRSLKIVINFIKNQFKEAKVVFQETDEQEEMMDSDEKFDLDEDSQTYFTRIKEKLFSKSDERHDKNHSLLEADYQPIFQRDPDKTFEIYRESQSSITTHNDHSEQVLDLDYFDHMQSKDSVDTMKHFENSIDKVEQIKDDEKELLATDMNHDDTDQSSNEDEKDMPQVSSAAQHWQSQATQTQDLTDNSVEKLLEKSEEPQIKKIHKKAKTYQFPGKSLLKKIPPVDQSQEYARINVNMEKLERTFESFGVKAKVVKANLGPTVTKYEIQPATGVKVSKIVSLSDDIALALAARDIRMEAPIPGKSLIGIEVPNTQVSPVSFSEIIDAALETPSLLEVPLGRDISGSVCLADLSKMPHLLIAGATGSGKSVGMNVIIVSLLMKAHPNEVKFLMIDPKKVELTMYNDLPHQLTPVVTNPRKAAQALNKVVQEMERRYELFAESSVRNIDAYNELVEQWNKESKDTVYETLPKIVVFIDELADLMMVASNDVEAAIIRLAQMARAAGIHMIIATQRPSVDVITGIIKANVPSRLAFAVSSGTDSRTILDSVGAEKLLGRGDMLFQPMGKNKPIRVQGAYISDSEVERITDFIKQQQVADYETSTIKLDDEQSVTASISEDEYFGEAVAMLEGLDTISISQLQRRFRIGYNRAARLIDDMYAAGLVGEQEGSKPRQVL